MLEPKKRADAQFDPGPMPAGAPIGQGVELAVQLVNRLLQVEGRLIELEQEKRRLAEAQSGPGDHSYISSLSIEPANRKHEWPLAERPGLPAVDLGPYDVRVDDDVVLVGRVGEEFMAKFALQSEAPDFLGAITQVNSDKKTLAIAGVGDAAPIASIVIPLYGQLAYTLNCLQSLFVHGSKYTAEIILIDDASPDQTGELLPKVEGIRYYRQAKNGGFIESCNTGGRVARGKFMIMLNNDTRVVPGWLDELVGSFDLWPNAGLVGSKMHYADGSLQEAGGIIWRDGSAWNYGRNDDPNRPQYSYARQVDYISGCSICIPSAIWLELEGFDARYRPAYCEDADMALAIRRIGKQVWFQPRSRIVHYEGKTSGTDTGKGVKAYQVMNSKKLFLKWRLDLDAHRPNGEAPVLERERSVRRRMLVVDATAPTPDQDAGSVQTVLGLRVCQMLGYKTYFVPEDNWLYQPKYLAGLQREGVECGYAPYELGFEAYMGRYGPMFDVVMVYRISIMERTLECIRKFAPQAIILFHVADLHFLRMQRTAELFHDKELMESARLMKERELGIIQQVDCTITHSEFEADLLAAEVPESKITLWPLMFDFFGTEKAFSDRRDVMFLGGYRHPPNVDAVIYFTEQILPLLQHFDPQIRFIIAGANPSDEVKALANENVIVTGLVDDLAELFDKCRVFVCPLRLGAGTKGKVITALSYGAPIVSTSVGVEGTPLRDGYEVMVADDPAEFAKATLRLYTDEAHWRKLSQNGQVLVRDSFSTARGAKLLEEAIDKAYTHKLGLALTQGDASAT